MSKIFIAGPRAVSKLPDRVVERISLIMSKGCTVLVGDASGVDRLVQFELIKHGYQNVIVYATNGRARNNLGNWSVKAVPAPNGVSGRAYYTCKDEAMARDTDCGFMIWNGESQGTLNNMVNLSRLGKKTVIYLIPDNRFYRLQTLEEVQKLCGMCGAKALTVYSKLV